MASKPDIGDLVQVEKAGKIYKGILMPRAEGYDSEHVTIKLANGYNIGVKVVDNGTSLAKISLVSKQQPAVSAKPKLSFSKDKPKITIVTTGGTITSKVDYHTGGVTSLMTADELLDTTPELADFVNINIVSPFQKMSENMQPADWQSLATIVAAELNKEDVKGVIVTHGTDTLHYTASALSFMLRNLNKPVVVTGSQKSNDRPSSDGPMNLLCAAHLALSDIAEVGICMHGTMNDDYCLFNRGTKVRKMHTIRRDAFRPINDLPLAKVWPNGKIEKLNTVNSRTNNKVTLDAVVDKAALIKLHPGADPKILGAYEKIGCKGIVLEGTGLGNVIWDSSNSWLPAISSLVKKGIPVCITSQTLYGRINANAYTSLRLLKNTGVIHMEDMLSETAFVKLSWVLGHKLPSKPADRIAYVREEMLKNYAGEIQKRSLPETFLY